MYVTAVCHASTAQVPRLQARCSDAQSGSSVAEGDTFLRGMWLWMQA